mgnify:CR=1 FL=1
MVAGFLHAFVRHADVVKIANLAQIVNVIAPLLARPDDVLVQSIYWPFEMFSKRRAGTSLRILVDGPSYESPTHGTAYHVDASAILGDGCLHLFLTNRDEAAGEVVLRLADASVAGVVDAEILTGPDPKAENGWDAREVVQSAPFDGISVARGAVTVTLPPMSFVAATLRLD